MRSRRRGFTLLEMIVVIAILLLVTALLLPAIARVVDDSRVAACATMLKRVKDAMNRYITDVGSFPPTVQDWSRPWGADVGLVNRTAVRTTHVARWHGPYMEIWPVVTPWGGYVPGNPTGATGAYYISSPIALYGIDNNGVAGDDLYCHMNSNVVVFPPSSYILVDNAVDDGNAATGFCRDRATGGIYIDYYLGEGPRY